MLLDAISLPDDLQWGDEFSWSPVSQNLSYGVSGALFIQEGTMQAGRPITLEGKEDMAWITRETVLALRAKVATAGLVMTLVLPDTRSFQVMFRHAEAPLEVAPVKGFDGLVPGSWYKVNSIKLMGV